MARFSLVRGVGPIVTAWKYEFEAVSLVAFVRGGCLQGLYAVFPRRAAQRVTG